MMWEVGDSVTINSTVSDYHGKTGVIVGMSDREARICGDGVYMVALDDPSLARGTGGRLPVHRKKLVPRVVPPRFTRIDDAQAWLDQHTRTP